MPTQRIYYDDSFQREFTAEVLSCEPVAGGAEVKSVAAAWRVRLDRTAFYPASGGQPHDTGQLGEAQVAEVIDEVIDGDEEVIHIVDRPVALGTVSGRIAWERRFDHMQQHTGQHLLSAVFQQSFSLSTMSFHLGSEFCTIDLRGREPTQQVLDATAVAANEIVYEDRAVTVRYGTSEELADAGVRKTVDRAGVLRAMEIEGVELQPCGGTHVACTGQIGTILLRGVSKIRQDWRVEFACGRRAERLARSDFATLKTLAKKLNCSMQETTAAAERVVAERDAHFKSARAGIEKLAEIEARSFMQRVEVGSDGLRIAAKLFEGVAPEFVQCFAREVAKAERTVALIARRECGHVFFSQHPTAMKDMNALLAEGLRRVGGRGGGTRDAARGRLTEPGRAEDLLQAAMSQLGREYRK